MSVEKLLTSLLRYKAWADDGLYAGWLTAQSDLPQACRDAGHRVLDHAYTVDRIFACHLQGHAHGMQGTSSTTLPPLADLMQSARALDQWFVDYAGQASPGELETPVPFVFTDGTRGCMSPEEMLGHVVAHGGYHRGEVGRLLVLHTGSSPPDTFTAYLHAADPRRRHGA